MNEIKIKQVGQEQTVTFELESGLEVTAVIVVQAHPEDIGIGYHEFQGSPGVDNRIAWEVDNIEIISADIYCHDFDDFARLQTTSHELLKNIIEPKLEITQDIGD